MGASLVSLIKYWLWIFFIEQWSENAVGIAKFYQEQSKFRQAIHCLQAAQVVSPNSGDESDDDAMELQAKMYYGLGEFYRQWLETYIHTCARDQVKVLCLRSATTLGSVDADDYDEFQAALDCPNDLHAFESLSLRKPEPFTLLLNYEEVNIISRVHLYQEHICLKSYICSIFYKSFHFSGQNVTFFNTLCNFSRKRGFCRFKKDYR